MIFHFLIANQLLRTPQKIIEHRNLSDISLIVLNQRTYTLIG